MDSAVAVRNERIRPDDKQEPSNLILHNNAITRALAYAAGLLGATSGVKAQLSHWADLAMASALIYLDLRLPELDWRSTHPNLMTWFDRMVARHACAHP